MGKEQKKVIAVYGSPRKKGNSARLLDSFVQGVEQAGGEVKKFYLCQLKIHPCVEDYYCRQGGECSIKDDFQLLRDEILAASGLVLASPIFFYSVTAQTKIFIDRFQSLWVKKYFIDKVPFGRGQVRGKGVFISVGATKGKKLFDGTLLTIKYFFDTLDMELSRALLYRGLDGPDDILEHEDFLKETKQAGQEFYSGL